jgi:hypothetical protein
MKQANTSFHGLPLGTARDDLEARISRLRSLAITIEDPESAARMTDFILGLEVQLLEIT